MTTIHNDLFCLVRSCIVVSYAMNAEVWIGRNSRVLPNNYNTYFSLLACLLEIKWRIACQNSSNINLRLILILYNNDTSLPLWGREREILYHGLLHGSDGLVEF